MTAQKPTGVFVRLPLSDEQHDTLYHTIRSSGDEVALCAIGTQVPGSGLLCIGNIVWFENDREPVLGSYVPAVFKKGAGVPVVSLLEAQAQIAARDAKIGRLREALDALENANNNLCFMRSKDTYQSMLRDGCKDLLDALDRARLGARKALKGGAA